MAEEKQPIFPAIKDASMHAEVTDALVKLKESATEADKQIEKQMNHEYKVLVQEGTEAYNKMMADAKDGIAKAETQFDDALALAEKQYKEAAMPNILKMAEKFNEGLQKVKAYYDKEREDEEQRYHMFVKVFRIAGISCGMCPLIYAVVICAVYWGLMNKANDFDDKVPNWQGDISPFDTCGGLEDVTTNIETLT